MQVRRSTVLSAAVLGTLALSALPLPAQLPPGGGLSLAEAVSMAQENNPGYLTQQNQLRTARWNVRSAYGSWLPSVNVSNSFGYTAEGERRLDDFQLGGQPATYSSRYNLGLSLSVSGNTLLAPRVAQAQSRATEQQVEGAAANLAAQVTQAYLAVLEARDQVRQAEREVERTGQYVRLAEARFEVGAGTQLDVRRSEVQQGQAEVQLVQARNAAANQLLALGQILGVRLSEDTELTERFALFEPGWDAEALIAIALRENPSLRASRAQADAAATQVRAARSAYLPSLTFSAGLSGFVSQTAVGTNALVQDRLSSEQSRYNSCLEQNQIRLSAGLNPNNCATPLDEATIREQISGRSRFPFDYSRQPANASLTLSIPLFNGLNRELQVEQARIARLNAGHQVRSEELRLQVEIETALRNLEAAYSLAVLQQRIRQTAEEELRLAEERFRFGATTSVEVVDAQANLAGAERDEIAAVYTFHRSIAELEAQLGEPLQQ